MTTVTSRAVEVTGHALWASEARRARGRLYPPTVFYTAYGLLVLVWAFRRPHKLAVAAWFAAGVVVWTFLEYLIHRYVLHGRFPDGDGIVRHFLHKRFDSLHWEHHARPWDAEHISGRIQDTLPFTAVLILLSFLSPLHTGPVLMAGILMAGVVEEWVHHSVHFYHFKNPYFRYIKRHHLYHHSPRGEEAGYGLTSGLWDVVWDTRYPEETRQALYRRTKPGQDGARSCPLSRWVRPCSNPRA